MILAYHLIIVRGIEHGDHGDLAKQFVDVQPIAKDKLVGDRKTQIINHNVRLAPVGPKLGLAEGLEDAATVQQETGLPCWAALGTSNLAKLRLPAVVREVVIIADRGQAGETAAQAAVEAYVAHDRAVYIAWPPDGHNDFNAALQAAALIEQAA